MGFFDSLWKKAKTTVKKAEPRPKVKKTVKKTAKKAKKTAKKK